MLCCQNGVMAVLCTWFQEVPRHQLSWLWAFVVCLSLSRKLLQWYITDAAQSVMLTALCNRPRTVTIIQPVVCNMACNQPSAIVMVTNAFATYVLQ